MNRLLILFICLSLTAFSKDPYPINKSIDVLHYAFRLMLSNSSDVIKGSTRMTIRFRNPVKEFEIDLAKKKTTGKGMVLLQVGPSSVVESFVHTNSDRIKIILKAEAIA